MAGDRFDVEAELDRLFGPGFRGGHVYRGELRALISRARGAALEEAASFLERRAYADTTIIRDATVLVHAAASVRALASGEGKGANHTGTE